MNRRGQRDAFEAMTRPHLASLYRTALRMTGQVQAAEDLVQDTCLKAYRSFGAHREDASYKAWLFRIMMNAHIDHVRRKTEVPVLDLENCDADGGDAEQIKGEHAGREYSELAWQSRVDSDPEARALHKSFLNHALRAIDRLPTEVRAVVILAILEEHRYEEIADILDCPVGTVRSRLSRGRQLLQAELAKFNPHQLSAAVGDNRVEQLSRTALTGGDE